MVPAIHPSLKRKIASTPLTLKSSDIHFSALKNR